MIEHPVRPDFKLEEDGPKPEEKTAGLYRFRVSVDPKKTEKLVINEVRPLYATLALTNITNDQIDLFQRQKSITP